MYWCMSDFYKHIIRKTSKLRKWIPQLSSAWKTFKIVYSRSWQFLRVISVIIEYLKCEQFYEKQLSFLFSAELNEIEKSELVSLTNAILRSEYFLLASKLEIITELGKIDPVWFFPTKFFDVNEAWVHLLFCYYKCARFSMCVFFIDNTLILMCWIITDAMVTYLFINFIHAIQ